MIELSKIKVAPGTQSRAEVNTATVAEYTEHIISGGTFPPVIIFFDGSAYWLADGWHRYWATKAAGCLTILEEIRPGTQRDAQKYSLGANHNHGLPRTNADKRKAVNIALNDTEWKKLSDVKVAELCAVTQPFVLKIRHELAGTSNARGGITVIPPLLKPAPILDVEISLTKEETDLLRNPHGIDHEPTEPEYTELDAAHDTITSLQDMLAAGVMALSDDDKDSANEYISGLRAEIKTLKATVAAITISRDTFQNENVQLKRQVAMIQKKMDKLAK